MRFLKILAFVFFLFVSMVSFSMYNYSTTGNTMYGSNELTFTDSEINSLKEAGYTDEQIKSFHENAQKYVRDGNSRINSSFTKEQQEMYKVINGPDNSIWKAKKKSD